MALNSEMFMPAPTFGIFSKLAHDWLGGSADASTTSFALTSIFSKAPKLKKLTLRDDQKNFLLQVIEKTKQDNNPDFWHIGSSALCIAYYSKAVTDTELAELLTHKSFGARTSRGSSEDWFNRLGRAGELAKNTFRRKERADKSNLA